MGSLFYGYDEEFSKLFTCDLLLISLNIHMDLIKQASVFCKKINLKINSKIFFLFLNFQKLPWTENSSILEDLICQME